MCKSLIEVLHQILGPKDLPSVNYIKRLSPKRIEELRKWTDAIIREGAGEDIKAGPAPECLRDILSDGSLYTHRRVELDEHDMFFVLRCHRCRGFSLLEPECKTDNNELCCPHCGTINLHNQYDLMSSSSVIQMEDTTLYRIWHSISTYIKDAHIEGSITDVEHEAITKDCRTLLKLFNGRNEHPRLKKGKQTP